LGYAVGNALEIVECIETLSGRGPADLESLVVRLASRMVQLGKRAERHEDAEAQVRDALTSGAALATFEAMVGRQGGDTAVIRDPARLPRASQRRQVEAPRSGYVTRIDAEAVGRAAMFLGAGRARADATIDPAAGVMLLRKPGDVVAAGDAVLELHFNTDRELEDAIAMARSAIEIANDPPVAAPLVLAWVHAEGETSYV
jgi:pyrimidine-nucleoside phosphorylase